MVLLATIIVGEQAYGATIRQKLHEIVGRDVSVGALYATMERLESKGFVESRMGEATAKRGGRAKRYFAVTGQGKQALSKARDAMNSLWQHVSLSSHLQTI